MAAPAQTLLDLPDDVFGSICTTIDPFDSAISRLVCRKFYQEQYYQGGPPVVLQQCLAKEASLHLVQWAARHNRKVLKRIFRNSGYKFREQLLAAFPELGHRPGIVITHQRIYDVFEHLRHATLAMWRSIFFNYSLGISSPSSLSS